MKHHPLKCPDGSRTHAIAVSDHLIRIRCRDRSCADVRQAKADNAAVYHTWDLRTGTCVATDVDRPIDRKAA